MIDKAADSSLAGGVHEKIERLPACLEANESAGVVYHRSGITGDYDDFDDVEQLMEFIMTGRR